MVWLIDNLGMAYGISGDLEKAKETFEYGVSKDPAYPLFHYNLACTYAEMDDATQAGSYLRKAFEYKSNLLPAKACRSTRGRLFQETYEEQGIPGVGGDCPFAIGKLPKLQD